MENAARLGAQDPANEEDLDELKVWHIHSVCEEKLPSFVRLDSGLSVLTGSPSQGCIFWSLNRAYGEFAEGTGLLPTGAIRPFL